MKHQKFMLHINVFLIVCHDLAQGHFLKVIPLGFIQQNSFQSNQPLLYTSQIYLPNTFTVSIS